MSHANQPTELDPLIDRTLSCLAAKPSVYLIAIVGVPGSGKSTFSQALSKRLSGSIVLPMDGYHLPRIALDAEQMKRRGAPHTFDSEKLRQDLVHLRENRVGSFPSFHHDQMDPIPDDIKVERDQTPVIVEGNYLLLQAWKLADLFDFRIFIDCSIDLAMHRVRERLVNCKIVATPEAAAQQVEANDRLNAKLIIEDGTPGRADVVLDYRSPL